MHYLKHKTLLFTCASVHKIHYNLTLARLLKQDVGNNQSISLDMALLRLLMYAN